jgi:hypothetical protein
MGRAASEGWGKYLQYIFSAVDATSAAGRSREKKPRQRTTGKRKKAWGGNRPPGNKYFWFSLDFFSRYFFCSAGDEFHGDIFTRGLFCQVDLAFRYSANRYLAAVPGLSFRSGCSAAAGKETRVSWLLACLR